MVHWFTAEVWPNIAASVIWAAPAFVVNHLLLRRHITNTAAQRPEQAKESAP